MRRQLFTLLLAVLAMIFSGCLDSKKYSDVSYDAKTDTFRMLRIYYHIHSSEQDDRTYLINMAMNRENILPMDLIGLFVESAQLRIDGKNYYPINLGAMAEKPKELSPATWDLSKIVNKPGKFFLAGENSLGYYHQIEIPGAQMDEIFASFNDEMRSTLTKTMETEVKRRQDGGAVQKWDKIRDTLIKQIAGGGKEPLPNREPAEGEVPFNCLSDDTVKLIQKAIADKKIGFERKGAEFSLGMPATAEDRKALMDLRDAAKNELRKALETDPNDAKSKTITAVLDAISITNDEKSGQIVTVADFVKVRKALQGTPGLFDLSQKADPAKQASLTKTLAAMKEAGVEIDEKIKLEEIPAMWEKGTLPVYKAEKAVEPGTGMFKAPGAKSGPRDPEPNPALVPEK